jgi:anti-anti-sigma factor
MGKRIAVERVGDIYILILDDVSTAGYSSPDNEAVEETKAELLKFIEDSSEELEFVVDMARVSSINGVFVGMLIQANKSCRKRRQRLKLCSATPDVEEVFRILRLNRLIEIYSSRAEAIASFDDE